MERILTQDERIRRAEEIYARRQNLRERTKKATLNVSNEPKKMGTIKRLILQTIISVLIYFIFYLINTTNYSFSAEVLDKTEKLVKQDIDFACIYNNVKDWFGTYIESLNITKQDTNEVENQTQEQSEVENHEETNQEENIGQGNSENEEINNQENQNENIVISAEPEETTGQTEIKETELSETDRIKQKYSFILPIKRHSDFRIWNKRINL